MQLPRLLRPVLDQVGIACFHATGKTPFAPGYSAYRNRLMRRMLGDDTLLAAMHAGAPLPPGHGVGLDERCIEYPWALSHLQHARGCLLDAGSVMNNELLMVHPVVARQTLHILTLAPEPECFWSRGVSYLYGDLRHNPVRDAFYDNVVCLSTLEHVGCDNSNYSGRSTDREDRRADYREAIRELARVLRPGGTLLFTVPFGRHAHHGWLQIFDELMIEDAVTSFGPAREREDRYYRYTPAGWNISTVAECADATYTTWMAQGGSAHSRWPTREADGAAAARAVACIRLVKS
jgi:SAM-dependent methyltransferase